VTKARRWAPTVLASCFLLYFALQFYCDFWRPEPPGAVLLFEGTDTSVESVAPDSPASRAGLRPGDVIRTADGHPIASRLDWMAIDTNIRPGRPIPLVVRRDGQDVAASLVMQWGRWADWRAEGGGLLLAVRLTQAVSLILAFVLAVKRPAYTTARRAVWLLATLGTFSIVLPARFADVWRAIPPPFNLPFWIPYLSNGGVGAIFLTFFLSFPRPMIRFRITWVALWTPIAVGVIWHARLGALLLARADVTPAIGDHAEMLLGANFVYLLAGVGALAWNYHRLDVNERRRVRVLMIGVTCGVMAGAPLAGGYWLSARADYAHSSYLSSPVFAFATILILMLPLSLTYAVLRHRLFDVSVILRIGVRYALARGMLSAVMPAIAAAMVVDALVHGDQPLLEVVVSRAWIYLALAGAAWIAYRRQRGWLETIDRRFFREKYDAHRLLGELAADIRQARSLDRVAPKAVAQIEAALHPQFASVMVRPADSAVFETTAASPAGRAPSALPASGALVGLMRVLGKPIEIAIDDTGWLQQQLPADETARLKQEGIDLVVPVALGADRSEVILALGVKRSEEPYSGEDLQLLTTIADALALPLELSTDAPGTSDSLRECPDCGACYDTRSSRCAAEGAALVPSPLPRLLAGRYRIERRLGRGGMGTVYAATDTALERAVAAKVMRIEVAAVSGAAARFQREARAAASFAHPNVVTVHDFGMMSAAGGGQAFLVMELLEGRTLRDALRNDGPIAATRTLAILEGVCAGVAAAHELRLVHRDLKPENIFLAGGTDRERPKILDFGIAKTLAAALPSAESDLMTGGGLLGTIEYMAPEQLRGEEPSPAWDLWALAVVSYEMLTGSHPFAGMAIGDAPRVGTYRAFVSDRLAAVPGCAAVFTRALALDPGQRPATASAFFADLSAALSGSR
jgi:serine/threonine-protein kinase